MIYYYVTGAIIVTASSLLLCLAPIIVIAGFALGAGLIFSIITAKYRDLSNMLNLIISLLMFVCPIFYSTSLVSENIKWIVNINPLSPLFEMFRYALFGIGQFTGLQVLYSSAVMLLLLLYGVLLFNKRGDELIDVI